MNNQITQPVWLEVALNGAAGPGLQPGIPVSPEAIIRDGIACAKAGAAIVHLHVYDKDGKPCEDVDIYCQVIEGIKNGCDAIVYPTLALSGSIEERYAPIEQLGRRGLLEWGVIDPGSVNISHRSQVASGSDGILYPNPDAHIRAGLALAEAQGWRPAYAIYEPGFARLGAAMAALFPALKTPVYRIMFSDNLLFGTEPKSYALDFYAQHLANTCPGAPWMVSGLDADINALLQPALAQGAHLRTGLEDAPFGCQLGNLELVEQAVNAIEQSGRELATPQQVRTFGH